MPTPAGGRDERISETQERFLRAAAARLPLERVVELHLFPATRQGGTETGFAVIAARRQPREGEGEGALEASEGVPASEANDALPAGAGSETAEADGAIEASRQEASPAESRGGPPHVEVAPDSSPTSHPSVADEIDSPPTVAQVPDEGGAGLPSPDLPEPADERLVVFSARYRLTLKGPERGRWEVEVIEEADAPLVTVDAVVRGMQRRIGEGAEPERLTAEQLHALLDDPAIGSPAG